MNFFLYSDYDPDHSQDVISTNHFFLWLGPANTKQNHRDLFIAFGVMSTIRQRCLKIH